MANGIIGLYSSFYSEPRMGLRSLGGDPQSLLDNSNAAGAVFNTISEEKSSSSFEDFRIIYVRNISMGVASIKSFLISVHPNHDEFLDRSTKLYLSGVTMSLFSPPYLNVNIVHPPITAEGNFRNEGVSLRDTIKNEATILNYGSGILMDTELAAGDFIGLVLHRKVKGPLTFLQDYKFSLRVSLAVG